MIKKRKDRESDARFKAAVRQRNNRNYIMKGVGPMDSAKPMSTASRCDCRLAKDAN